MIIITTAVSPGCIITVIIDTEDLKSQEIFDVKDLFLAVYFLLFSHVFTMHNEYDENNREGYHVLKVLINNAAVMMKCWLAS